MAVAEKCKSLSEFQKQYAIWDFGENHTSSEKDFYPHDNFVYNMNKAGYKKMRDGLANLIERIDSKEKMAENFREEADKTSKVKIGIEEIVSQDTSILFDKKYMEAVASVLEKGNKLDKSEIGESK